MKSYVLGFCFNRELDKVVLIRKTRPEWQRGRLNGVGGHVEPGETPKAAMEREFREEADWQDPCDWIPFGKLSGDGWEVHLFRGTYASVPSPFNDSEEGMVSCHFVTCVLKGISKESPVLPNVRWLIPMAINHAMKVDKAEYFNVREMSFEEGREDDDHSHLNRQVQALRDAIETVSPGLACRRPFGDGQRDCEEELSRPEWEPDVRAKNVEPCAPCRARAILATVGLLLSGESTQVVGTRLVDAADCPACEGRKSSSVCCHPQHYTRKKD